MEAQDNLAHAPKYVVGHLDLGSAPRDPTLRIDADVVTGMPTQRKGAGGLVKFRAWRHNLLSPPVHDRSLPGTKSGAVYITVFPPK